MGKMKLSVRIPESVRDRLEQRFKSSISPVPSLQVRELLHTYPDNMWCNESELDSIGMYVTLSGLVLQSQTAPHTSHARAK